MNYKGETHKNQQLFVNYSFKNFIINGLSNEPESKTSLLTTTTALESPAHRRSLTKLQPQYTNPSQRSLPTSTAPSSPSYSTTSLSNSPNQQKTTTPTTSLNSKRRRSFYFKSSKVSVASAFQHKTPIQVKNIFMNVEYNLLFVSYFN